MKNGVPGSDQQLIRGFFVESHMLYLKHSWLGYALMSLTVHGAILYAALPWKGHDMGETIQISVITEMPSYNPRDSEHKPGAIESKKPSYTPQKVRKIDNPPLLSKTATAKAVTENSTQSPAPSPSLDKLVSQPSGNISERMEAQSPGSSHGVATRASNKDTAGTTGEVVSATGTVKGIKGEGISSSPANTGSNQGPVQFGTADGPRFIHREVPEYPLYARRRKKEGKVVLMVRISERGELSSVEVVEASDPIFVAPSLEAVKKSTFHPAVNKGTPVAVSALLPIRFILDESLSFAQNRNS
jgi:TonB family protein